jgi:hypothetical protein
VNSFSLRYEVVRAAVYAVAALMMVNFGMHGWWLLFSVAIYGLFFSNWLMTLMWRVDRLYAGETDDDDTIVELRGNDGKRKAEDTN